MEVSFELEAGTSLLEKAEAFDPAYDDDAQKLCGVKGADARGGVGPFGLWVLASADLQERTAVFFRVFRDGHGKPKVLMCTDPTKYDAPAAPIDPSFFDLTRRHNNNHHVADGLIFSLFFWCLCLCRSSLSPDLYKPTFAGFVDADISSGKIALRSLVRTNITLALLVEC